MEAILGGLFLVLLFVFAIWRNRVDAAKHGPLTRSDRNRTYLFAMLWFVVLLIAFYLYVPIYIGVIVVFYIYSQVFGVGEGKRGLYRQIRDSGFVASVASIPVCLLIWVSGNA